MVGLFWVMKSRQGSGLEPLLDRQWQQLMSMDETIKEPEGPRAKGGCWGSPRVKGYKGGEPLKEPKPPSEREEPAREQGS